VTPVAAVLLVGMLSSESRSAPMVLLLSAAERSLLLDAAVGSVSSAMVSALDARLVERRELLLLNSWYLLRVSEGTAAR